MAQPYLCPPFAVRMTSGVTVAESDGRYIFNKDGVPACTLTASSPQVRAVVGALSGPGVTEGGLWQSVGGEAPRSVASTYYLVDRLLRSGLLSVCLMEDATPIAQLVPSAWSFRFTTLSFTEETYVQLSRFTFLRAVEGGLHLESPEGCGKIILSDTRCLVYVQALAKRVRVSEIRDLPLGLGPSASLGLLSMLVSINAVKATMAPHGEEIALRHWEFHDLLFHTRSRLGRHGNRFGATFRFAPGVPPAPVVKPTLEGRRILLPVPDLDTLMREDRPFADVLETRCSTRLFAARPLSLQSIGELLYRTARLRAIVPAAPESGCLYDFSNRPYPSCGAAYELELYLVTEGSDDPEPGVYHYDPSEHHLCLVAGITREAGTLLSKARAMQPGASGAGLLFVITARIRRLAWKYEGLAYASVLKDVGCLLQTVYLAATAMGLGVCAVGSGDSDLFARVAGLSYYEETSVGEFMIGYRPE